MMKLKTWSKMAVVAGMMLALASGARAQYLMENLGRGVVAVRQSSAEVYVGWRMLGTDPSDIAFNLYRSTGGGPAVQLNAAPIADTTNFVDGGADLSQSNAYFVRPVVGGVERAASAAYTLAANAPVQQYLNVPLQIPAGGTTPDGVNYTYTANDASVADLDGDREYEIVLKWDPTNSKDNSQSGYTGNVFIDAYKMDGTRLWRIDLGRNIRAGAHYTQFMVYDLDGDGKAELACKTADGTVDGVGAVIGNASADFRNSSGYVLSGPEFLTVFNGQTGAAMATVSYNPPRGTVSSWGDSYGNRVDRFLAGVAYLDGKRPSLVMARGYYTRAFVAAWDWRDGQLTNRWNFDTGHTGTSNQYSAWRGQGAHSLTIGDVDGDGKHEITYGAAAIDDNGTGLYTTNLGHGDALHMSDMNPDRPGQEVWMVHEDPGSYGANGSEFRDARTGQLIFGVSGEGVDVGRGVAMDIDPNHRGYEMWSSRGGLMSANGVQISTARPSQMNFAVWWDGDLLRELEDGTAIRKWNWTNNTTATLLSPAGIASNNSTKATPALSADILGDWREEVIWRTSDNTALRIYTTTIPAQNRIYTLMHDAQYRVAIAWQNTAYNQPPHPSFYLGDGMGAPPTPNIITSLGARVPVITTVSDDTGASSGDRVTNDAALTLSGTADAASAVTVSLDGLGVVGTTTADATGAWTFDYTQTTLADGAYVFIAVATDAEGRNSPESVPFIVTVDTVAPAAPTITAISGGSFVFKGTAEAGSTVAVTRTGAGLVGTTTAGPSGAWALTYAGSLAQGQHSFTATATDAAGNASAPSSEFAVDTALTVPAITGVVTDTGVSPNDNITNDTTLTLVGTAGAGHTVTVSRADLGVVGATAADASGAWTFDYAHTTLAPGTYVFTAVASDGPGASSLTSPDFTVTIEETAPAVVSVNRHNPTTATTNVSTVVFRVTFSEAVNGVDANDFVLTTTNTVAGNIASVSAGSGTVFDVTVNSITGTGTVRLDLRAAATGISDNAGNAVAGGFTAGQSYTISSVASGVWVNSSGGAWSNTANWNGGTVANGAGSTADFGTLNLTTNAVVQLDFARTIGHLTFGDTSASSAASWSLAPAGGDLSNNLTLAVSSGTPTITVGALGAGATTNISTPLFSTGGLTKAGTGTLVLGGANTYNGATTVSGGTLRVANGGSIQTTTVDVANTAAILNINGGSLTASGMVTVAPGGSPASLIIDSGTVNLNGGLRTTNGDGAIIRIHGGTVTAASVNLQRGSYTTSPSYNNGFIVTGGTTTVNGTVGLGTLNSSSSLSVEGGTLNVNGTITVANQQTGGRGGALRVTGGTFNANDEVNGIVMSRTNGSNANNVSFATFSGGTSTVEKFTLGFDSTVTAGSATITVSGTGALYVGSGGIVKKGANGMTTVINLSGGTLGAAADWSSDLPMTLPTNGNIQIKAADATNLPQDIRLNGVVSGAGGFTKTGAGTLALTNSNTYTGATHVNAGTLRVNGSVVGAGAFNVNGGGTLSGSGSVNRTVTLGSGGTVSPEGNSAIATLGASALTWNGGGQLAFDLGAASDQLAISGAFNKGSAGAHEFVFNPGAGLVAGTTYTLATFGSTNFTAADFTHTGLPADMKGEFKIVGNTLQFTVLDAVPPTLHLPADITLEATGPAGAVATFAATAEDNAAGNVNITYSHQSGDTFPVGTTAVNVTATDEAGNTATGTFNVTVRDTAAPTIQCPPDIIVVAAPGASTAAVTLDLNGSDTVSVVTFTSSPASGSAFPLGTTTVNATAKDAAGNIASCSFTVTVRSATTTTVAPAAAQYSDAVSLRATVAAAPVAGQALTGSVQFFVGGTPVGTAPLAGGAAELPLTLANSAASVYDVTARFTSANPAFYTDSNGGPAALTVGREDAAASYTGDSSLLTAGPGVTTATVRLGARLVPESDGAGFVGDITKATVSFELFKSNNLGGTPDLVVGNVPVNTSGDAQAVVGSLPAELYSINVKVDTGNQYWTANPVGIGVLNVVVPTDEQQTSGGGWVEDAASRNGKSNFGFNVRAGSKAGQAHGSLTFTLRGADGFNYVLKSNTWSDGYLQFAAEPGVTPETYTRSNFKGRASLQKVDPVTGAVVASAGNYTFEVFTADGDQLTPRRADAISITVRDGDGQLWHQLSTPQTLVTLGGGNVTNKAK